MRTSLRPSQPDPTQRRRPRGRAGWRALERDGDGESAGRDRWIVSYADLVTLLLALFVVMYAISVVDQKRFQEMQRSVKWALHMAGSGQAPGAPGVHTDGPPDAPNSAARLESARAQVVRALDRAGAPERARVLAAVEDGQLVVRIEAHGVFDGDDARIRPDALPLLDALLREAAALPGAAHVRIEARGAGWAQASARGAAVAGYAEAGGLVPADLLRVQAAVAADGAVTTLAVAVELGASQPAADRQR